MAIDVKRSPGEVRRQVRAWQREGLTVGLVPTMGALHEGHLSLVRASIAQCDRTVVSIYVNPTQFPGGEDFDRYPRRLARDCRTLEAEGAHLVFAPSDEAMYLPGFCTYVVQQGLTEGLCGAFREGHFRGVLTAVVKLLQIVPADRAYFGRKDFQQSVVVRRMVQDLNVPVEVCVMPTVRDKDGLALSSRNQYLAPEQRREAVCLYEALVAARRLFRSGVASVERLAREMRGIIARYPDVTPQYVEIVAPDTLQTVAEATEDCVAALAVFIGETRLIDNMPLGECEDVLLGAP